MPTEIKSGDGKRFRVVWNWYAAQDSSYQLFDREKLLLKVEDDNPDVRGWQLFALCELLNQLAGE